MILLGVATFFGYRAIQEPMGVAPLSQEEIVNTEIKEGKDLSNRSGGMIDMRNQGLSTVPGYIFNKVGTSVLLLSDNTLSGSLPAEVRNLQDLQVLDISNNTFTGVPAEIGQLQKLEMLNLSGNPITGLPLELGNLKNLKVLDLRDTTYSEYDLNIIKQSLPADVEIRV